MSNYGKIDILWLDAGWVAKQSTEEINHFYSKELKKTEPDQG